MSRHQHHHHHHGPQEQSGTGNRGVFFRDKRFVVAVILMLIGIMVYVMTMDESEEPAEGGAAVSEVQ